MYSHNFIVFRFALKLWEYFFKSTENCFPYFINTKLLLKVTISCKPFHSRQVLRDLHVLVSFLYYYCNIFQFVKFFCKIFSFYFCKFDTNQYIYKKRKLDEISSSHQFVIENCEARIRKDRYRHSVNLVEYVRKDFICKRLNYTLLNPRHEGSCLS